MLHNIMRFTNLVKKYWTTGSGQILAVPGNTFIDCCHGRRGLEPAATCHSRSECERWKFRNSGHS